MYLLDSLKSLPIVIYHAQLAEYLLTMHTDPLFGIYGLRIPERQVENVCTQPKWSCHVPKHILFKGTSTSDVQEFDDTSSRVFAPSSQALQLQLQSIFRSVCHLFWGGGGGGGVDGVVCLIDDILVFGRSQSEHDNHLQYTLERIKNSGVTLNYEKCVFSQNSVKFFGQIVDQNGIKPDPEKVNAIACMAELTNVSEIRRFLGMVNQHSKFSPKLAELTKPLWYLLSKKNQWMWGQKQKDAFDQVKKELIVRVQC